MLHSRIFIWVEFLLVAVPTTLGAALLIFMTISILTNNSFEFSYQDALLWLVPIGTVFGVTALWTMFFGLVKKRPISRLVVYGFAAGIAVILFTVASGFDSRFQSWWALPILMVLNLGLPYVLVGCHWLILLKKRGLTRRSTGRAQTARAG